MKKIIVFGANGKTGSEIVKQALAAEYHVTAIVRNPSAKAMSHPNLTIIKGDAMQIESFRSLIKGNSAVISALGSGNTKPTKLFSEGVGNI